jgi:hypothetical protein
MFEHLILLLGVLLVSAVSSMGWRQRSSPPRV